MGRGYSYIDGSTKKPADETKLARRETHDAQIISWILGFVKPNNILESLAALEKTPAPSLMYLTPSQSLSTAPSQTQP